MSNFAENMSALLRQLEADEISPEQFKTLSAGLIDTVGTASAKPPKDPVRMERIDASAKLLREL